MGRRGIPGRRLRPRVATWHAFALAALLCTFGAGAAPASAAQPTINHVFVIVLENESFNTTFSATPPSPYLAKTLTADGAFLKNYYGIGHESLDNYVAMISGQPPNVQTQSDCQIYSDFAPFPATTIGSDGIVSSQMGGCVFPSSVQTVVNQLDSDGLSWRAYAQDMANGQPTSCRHPSLNSHDSTQSATASDQYAARHVPFLYFHSIIDTASCAANVVDLNRLPADLRQESTTPNYAFITPDLCADGHDATCADGKSPGGFAGIDAFLHEWVPRITSSPAYQDRGMLLIAFDEAADSDASACCNEQPGPNTPNPGGTTMGPGGGRVGAVALSPCIEPGTVSNHPYNHYSQLRWVEDNFGLSRLGFAAQAGLSSFGPDVFTQPGCEEQPTLKVRPKHPRAGKRTVFRFRVDSPLDRCKVGVEVDFAGKHKMTDGNGIARIRKRFHHKGVRVARTKAPTCDLASKRVRIKRAR